MAGETLRIREWSGIGAGISGIAALPHHGPAMPANEALELEQVRVREHIAFLNRLPHLLNPVLPEAQRQTVRQKVLAAKLHLMKGVWAQDWGPFEDFQLWVEGGGKAVDSEAFRRAAEFFAYGQEEPQ